MNHHRRLARLEARAEPHVVFRLFTLDEDGVRRPLRGTPHDPPPAAVVERFTFTLDRPGTPPEEFA